MSAEREVLVAHFSDHLSLLIPRKYRPGFLRQPLGPPYKDLARLLRHANIKAECVYGSLDIVLTDEQQREAEYDREGVLARLTIPVAMHYGYGYRVVSDDEFWANHPLEGGPDAK